MKISRVSLATLVGALLLPTSVFAATPTAVASSKISPAVVIATVNIAHAKIVSQSGRTIEVAFDISNRVGIQSAVKYGLSLVQSTKTGAVVADEKVFDEVLAFGEGATLHKQVTYVVPEQVSGTYDLLVLSRTGSGLPLASMLVGKVTFYPGTAGSVAIDPASCYLTVTGDAKNTHYTPLQGVDIAATESLEAHCSVANTAKEAITLTPSFVTHYRNVYGAVVSAPGGDTSSIALTSNEHTIAAFTLPKAQTPQAYDVTLALSNGGKVVSNTVKFHYVLQGASATIQNVVWDKAAYQSGDSATVSFSWAPSADSFSGARAKGTPLAAPTVELAMTDEHGVACALPVTLELGADLVTAKIPVTAVCANPQLAATIKDATRGVLATGHFLTTAIPAATPTAVPASSSSAPKIVLLVALLGLIGGGVFFVMKKKGTGADAVPPQTPPAAGMLLLALMIAGGMFGSAPQARADTWQIDGDVIYNTSIDTDPMPPGESIHITGTIERWACGNSVIGDLVADIDGVTIPQNGEVDPVYGPGSGDPKIIFSGSVGSSDVGGTQLDDSQLVAPNTNGTHYVSLGGWTDNGKFTFYDIPFTVIAPPAPVPAPVVTLTKNPNTASVTSGTPASISWSATNNPSSCSINRDGSTIASGLPASGNQPLGNLLSNTTITVTCMNTGGPGSASGGFTVTASVAPSATIFASPCTISAGASTCSSSVTWTISNATSPNVKQAGVQFSTTVTGSQSRTVPWGATGFTANDGATILQIGSVGADCASGSSWNGSICAAPIPVPTVADIKVNGGNGPVTVPAGGSATLSWTSTGATSCSVSPGGWTTLSLAGQSTGPLAATQTYTLNCNGAGGPASDSVTVNVTPNTPPNPPTITGASTGLPTPASYPFTFTATDPDGDTIHYEIDWDNNGTVDQTLPAGFVSSGTGQSQANGWGAVGSKTFKARTVDSRGGVSGWTAKTIVIDIPPALSVTPLGDYGSIVAGDTANKTITITNTGGGTLNVTGITDIAVPAHFTCVAGCSNPALAPGVPLISTIRLTVPSAYPPGALPSETIRVTASNAVNSPQDVAGWATVIPALTINPGPLDFGSVIIRKFVDKPMTLINNSNTGIPSGSIMVAAPFSCATSCTYPSIPAHDRVVVMMRYSPTVATPAGGSGDSGVATFVGAPQDNTGDMIGKGLPLTFNVIEQ